MKFYWDLVKKERNFLSFLGKIEKPRRSVLWKECPYCGKNFHPKVVRGSKYCSRRCSNRAKA